MAFDAEAIREQFPILARQVNGKPLAYFTAASAQKPRVVAGEIPDWVEYAAKEISGLSRVKVDLVFDQTWDSSRMSDEAKLRLNGF
jgi:selenocysteine lyase/cysteine desulfurase